MRTVFTLALVLTASLVFAGCNRSTKPVTQPSPDQMQDQQVVEEIKTTEDDGSAADSALDATDKAITELDEVDFGEAPDVE